MNIRISRRSIRVVAAVSAAAATLAIAPQAHSFAAEQDAKPGQPDISIAVSAFRDLGGAEYKAPDGRPLTERLVSALRGAIAESAKHTYHVADPTDPNVVAKNATAFVVESEVTAVDLGDAASRPYMLVSRLYREGKPRKLIAQFAGNARSLRDLTGNLSNQSGASNAGLVGGIGKQIVEAAENARPVGNAFDDMVKAATATHRVTVDVMSDVSGKQEPRQSVGAGQRYRLRVNSQDSGLVYIVTIDPATKRPSTPYAQNEPLDVAPGQPVTLPPNDPFIAPRTGTTMEYIVFVRKRGASKGADAGGGAATTPLRRPIQVASLRETGLGLTLGLTRGLTPRLIEPAIRGVFWEQADAIELLSSPFLKGPGSLDTGVTTLLHQFQGDPDGSWIATRVKITVTKSSETGGEGSAAPGTTVPR